MQPTKLLPEILSLTREAGDKIMAVYKAGGVGQLVSKMVRCSLPAELASRQCNCR